MRINLHLVAYNVSLSDIPENAVTSHFNRVAAGEASLVFHVR